MHLYVMARGQVDKLNKWENDLNGKYFKYVYGHQHSEVTGNSDLIGMYQLNIRPIRMYEIAFPETEINEVLGMINPQTSWNTAYNKYFRVMQMILKLDKIPEFKPLMNDALQHPGQVFDRKWIECAGIGIKKDKYENGIEQI